MRLIVLHPEVAFRDCQHCVKFFYEEDGPNIGKVRIGKDGNPEPRPPRTHPPCRRQESSCPKGTPENPITLTERNWRAWDHYKRCKLIGKWPDDPLVLEMGVLLDELMDRVRDARMIRAITAASMGGFSGPGSPTASPPRR